MNRVADGNQLVEKFIDNKRFYKGRDRYIPKNNGSTVIVMSTLVARPRLAIVCFKAKNPTGHITVFRGGIRVGVNEYGYERGSVTTLAWVQERGMTSRAFVDVPC